MLRWLADAEAGTVLDRSRKRYSRSTLRGYRQVLNKHILPEYGDAPVDGWTRARLNQLARALSRKGLAPSTVRNVMMPMRSMFRTLVDVDELEDNPSRGMTVPAGSGRRRRVLTVGEIAKFLRALPMGDRALWATAIYAGLRRGELMALRWDDIDLASGTLHVLHSFDAGAGDSDVRDPKTAAGRRKVAICADLREHLLEHRRRAGARPRGFVFARRSLSTGRRCRPANRDLPFLESTVGKVARQAAISAGIAPVTLHDCRHTFASLMIAAMGEAGKFNPKVLQTLMGHTSIQITYDRYGHLFPGAEEEAGRYLDSYLAPETLGDGDVAEVAEAVVVLLDTLDRVDRSDAQQIVSRAMAALGMWISGTSSRECVTVVRDSRGASA